MSVSLKLFCELKTRDAWQKKFRLCLDRDLCDLLDKNIIFAPSYLNKNTYGWNQVFLEILKLYLKYLEYMCIKHLKFDTI